MMYLPFSFITLSKNQHLYQCLYGMTYFISLYELYFNLSLSSQKYTNLLYLSTYFTQLNVMKLSLTKVIMKNNNIVITGKKYLLTTYITCLSTVFKRQSFIQKIVTIQTKFLRISRDRSTVFIQVCVRVYD